MKTKLKDLIKEDKVKDYIKQNEYTIKRLFDRMHTFEFLKGLEKDIKFHTKTNFTHEKLKDDLIDILFDGVEPEFKNDLSYNEWENF